jgi:dipeptidase D
MDTPIERVLSHFRDISAIPRCSKNEAQLRNWLMQWAEKHRLPAITDSAGNLVIKIAAVSGYEAAPTVVLQGHLDMVCEKTPDCHHNFDRDPIPLITDGEWLTARQTTLGADNGIAVAMAMALVEDETVRHPALELLFTVDEESGLNGAKKLDTGMLTGRVLINLDSETEGEFTIGCAGGMDTHISCGTRFCQLPVSFQPMVLKVSGLHGGHSGIDIHKGRANANVILARTLQHLAGRFDQRILSLCGGTAHNAIARDAAAGVAYPASDIKAVHQQLKIFGNVLKSENEAVEPGLKLRLEPETSQDTGHKCFTDDTAAVCLKLLLAMPHGALAMSTEMADLVESSTNFATIKTTASTVEILTSQRSSVASKLAYLSTRIEAIAQLAGARTRRDNGYPPWRPDPASPLLERCKSVFRQIFHADPKIVAIHAGLECALIGDRCTGMQMISFGPTIEDPHSPNERLNIPSVGRVWDFLTALLASFETNGSYR